MEFNKISVDFTNFKDLKKFRLILLKNFRIFELNL